MEAVGDLRAGSEAAAGTGAGGAAGAAAEAVAGGIDTKAQRSSTRGVMAPGF